MSEEAVMDRPGSVERDESNHEAAPAPAKARVLFVDDEPNILQGIRRQLRRDYDVVTAESGAAGLEIIEQQGEFPVVVSDMRMPEMNGNQFLERVRERCPDTLRIVLTGQADMESTIEAVNKGQIFRFLTKPCEPDSLKSVIDTALEHHRLVQAERELLENTLSGAVRTLTEVLALTNPVAGRQNSRINRHVEAMLDRLGVSHWQIRLASMLSQIGCITMPQATLDRVYTGEPLSPEEQQLLDSQYQVAASLMRGIPRLDEVAAIVAELGTPLAKDGLATAGDTDDPVALGRVLVRLAIEVDAALTRGAKTPVAVEQVVKAHPELPDTLRAALQALLAIGSDTLEPRMAGLRELVPGMVLDEDITAANGVCLCSSGQEISGTLLQRLRTIGARMGVREPFRVLAPT